MLFEHAGNGLFWIPGGCEQLSKLRGGHCMPHAILCEPDPGIIAATAQCRRGRLTVLLPATSAGALVVWLLPGLTPYQRTLVANLLAGFVVDIIVVGTIKGIVRRG